MAGDGTTVSGPTFSYRIVALIHRCSISDIRHVAAIDAIRQGRTHLAPMMPAIFAVSNIGPFGPIISLLELT